MSIPPIAFQLHSVTWHSSITTFTRLPYSPDCSTSGLREVFIREAFTVSEVFWCRYLQSTCSIIAFFPPQLNTALWRENDLIDAAVSFFWSSSPPVRSLVLCVHDSTPSQCEFVLPFVATGYSTRFLEARAPAWEPRGPTSSPLSTRDMRWHSGQRGLDMDKPPLHTPVQASNQS